MRSALRKLFRRDGRNLGVFVAANTISTMFLFYITEKLWGADYGLLDSFYWLGVTMPTLGYGDILPTLAVTKLLTVWIALSSFVAFGIGIALLGAHFVENPFENEVNDDNDDCILMLGMLLAHHGIEVPDSVEELTGKPTHYDDGETKISNFDRLYFSTHAEAKAVLNKMKQYVAVYGYVSVADLYEFIDEPSNFVDDRWGWDDLKIVTIQPTTRGYKPTLPKPKLLPTYSKKGNK